MALMGKIVELRLAVLDESSLVAKAGMVAVLSKMKIESVVVVTSRMGRLVRRGRVSMSGKLLGRA